jgi:peptide/nickel transport system substrate-binding protein
VKKRLWWLLILLLAIGTTLAACGEDAGTDADTEEGAEEGAENGAENGEDGTDENADADEASDAVDQTLIFARGGDSESLDYSSTTDGESSRITVQIFESLVQFEEDSFEIKEGLAHHWDVSDDGLSYVFHLREGVTFHDGTEFNAEAVKFNFERWSDPDHPHAYTDDGFVYSVYGQQFGGFKGDEGHIIKEINVLGDHEIEFVLNEPLGTFLQNMAMSYFAIASPASFEEHGPNVTENPVGTGPFKFVSWSRDDSIVLEKNEEYWMDGYPKLDRVIFQVIPDNSARLTALRAGEIDITGAQSSTRKKEAKTP